MGGLKIFIVVILILTSMVSFVGFFEINNWLIDLLSHFQFQYLFILIVGTAFFSFLKDKSVLFFIPFIISISIKIAPFFTSIEAISSEKKSLSLMCINLLSSNGLFDDVSEAILQREPDVLVLQEFTELWKIMIEPTLMGYPHKIEMPRQDNFGIAIYSKYELNESEIINLSQAEVPSIKTTILFENVPISIIGTHPVPPIGSQYFEFRNQQYKQLANLANSIKGEVIMVGDLNSTSFSPYFRNFLSGSDLKDTRKGFGLLTTWPTWLGIPFITLDHCLISNGLQTKLRETGNHVGSDHLPIYVELSLDDN